MRKLTNPLDSKIRCTGTICVELRDGRSGLVKYRDMVHNIVTNDGDQYYAEMCAGETPTNDFGAATAQIQLTDNSGSAPAKGSDYSDIGSAVGTGNPKAFDSGYPKSDDDDTDNPGRGVDIVTYRTSWTLAEAIGTIYRAAIHEAGASGSNPILMYGAFLASFPKTAADTLKVWINHELSGA